MTLNVKDRIETPVLGLRSGETVEMDGRVIVVLDTYPNPDGGYTIWGREEGQEVTLETDATHLVRIVEY